MNIKKLLKTEQLKSIWFSLFISLLLVLDIVFQGIIKEQIIQCYRAAFRNWIIVSWAAGVLMGHWYHPKIDKYEFNKAHVPVLIIIISVISGLFLIISGILYFHFKVQWPQYITFIAGFFAGWFLWPIHLAEEKKHSV